MKYKISLQTLKYFFIILPFIDIKFSNLTVLNTDRVLSIIRLLILCIYFLKNKDLKIKLNTFIVLMFLYYLSYLIPCIIYGNLTLRIFYLWSKEVIFNIGITFILQQLMEKNYTRTLKLLYNVLLFWIVIHNFFAFFSEIEVLGIRTRYTDYFLPSLILFMLLYSLKIEKLNLKNTIFLLTSMYFIIWQWISTCLVVIFLLIFFYITYRWKILRKIYNSIINYNFFISSVFALNIGIVFFRIQNFFKYIIVDILHEDLTLNNRTIIWDKVFERMRDHNIFLGAGIQNEGSKDVQMAMYNEYGYNILPTRQAHNQLLSVLFFNGILGVICYVGIIYIVGRKIKLLRNKEIKNLLIIGVTFICIAMITELSADGIMFFIFMLCAYNGPLLNKLRRKNEKSKFDCASI